MPCCSCRWSRCRGATRGGASRSSGWRRWRPRRGGGGTTPRRCGPTGAASGCRTGGACGSWSTSTVARSATLSPSASDRRQGWVDCWPATGVLTGLVPVGAVLLIAQDAEREERCAPLFPEVWHEAGAAGRSGGGRSQTPGRTPWRSRRGSRRSRRPHPATWPARPARPRTVHPQGPHPELRGPTSPSSPESRR